MIAAAILLKVTVVIVMALAAAKLARKSRAAVRYVLLAAAFVVLLILPIASIVAPAFTVAVPISTEQLPAPVVDALVETPRTVSQPDAGAGVAAASGTAAPLPWSSIALIVWITGAALFLVPLCAGLLEMRSLRRSSLPWREGQPVVDQLAAAGGISRRVDVLLHESISGPLTCGSASPVILLPVDAPSWPAGELHAAIVHELEHIRRRDWIGLCLARAVAACYWFHPVVWIARRQLALEAERACDDAVVERSEATAYADQLVALARRLSAASNQPQLAMANRSDLATRVVAVLDAGQRRGRAGALWIGAAIAATAIVVTTLSSIRIVAAYAGGESSSQGSKKKYDAATIKPCVAEENPTGARGTAGGTNASWSPGRFYVPCVTTEQLIYLAYASYGVAQGEGLVNDDPGSASNAIKVRGGPAWVHSLRDKYQIEATAAGATERVVLMGEMLQSLLEDRFKFKHHRETEEVPLLSLAVGKNGFKLKPMKDGDCDPVAVAGPVSPGGKPKCGNLNMMSNDEKTRWSWGTGTMSGLAGQLTRPLGMHVIDNTGITDKFVYVFEFQRGQDALETEGFVRSALDEQLGLKLEKTKGPRGFLVIDAIERPTPDEAFAAPARATGPGVARASQSSSQSFAVASIKPCQGGGPGAGMPSPPSAGRGAGAGTRSLNTITVNCQTLVEIISRAYMQFGNPPPLNIQNLFDPEKVTGGPDWARSDRYSIEAKADGTPGTLAMMGTMLRALLEERFQLKLHQELKDVRAFALTVAASGLKVKPSDPSSCEVIDPFSVAPAPAESGNRPRCTTSVVFNGPNLTLKATGQSFDRVSKSMGGMLMGVIIDQTATTDLFTFSVEFTRDENITALGPRVAQASDPPSAPTIFTAFEKQLGVKLVPTKAKQGFLVIDRVERPTPNSPAAHAFAGR